MRNPMTFVLKFLKIQISSGRISKESSRLNLLYNPLFSDQESFSLTSEVSKRCRKLRRSSKSNFLIKSSNGQKWILMSFQKEMKEVTVSLSLLLIRISNRGLPPRVMTRNSNLKSQRKLFFRIINRWEEIVVRRILAKEAFKYQVRQTRHVIYTQVITLIILPLQIQGQVKGLN